MTQLSVRQYLDLHGIRANSGDCLHLSKCARAYSLKAHYKIGRAEPFKKHVYQNLYDVRALDAVCQDFRISQTERHCSDCLKMKPKVDFYRKGKKLFPYCKTCYRDRRAKQRRTEDGFKQVQAWNKTTKDRAKVRRFAEYLEGIGGAANR